MLLAFSICCVIQIAYYLIFFRRLADYWQQPVGSENLPPVSVVICAHDEVKRLQKNLPSILEQKYPSYEVIVVNDQSNDDTELILMQLENKYPHLVVRHIHHRSGEIRGKKYPLTIGIRAAAYDHILLTDADCVPSSDHWIRDMAGAFREKTEIILGYAPYKHHPGILNKVIRFETFLTALHYFSFALAGVPYMGVGRNLSYRKNIFFDHNIYTKYPQLLSGDDDLLINQAANTGNTAIQINRSSFMYSEPKQTWEEYRRQKARHVSTARYYKWRDRILLSIFTISNLLFYILFLLILLYTNLWIEALLLFVLKVIVQGITLRTTMRKLCEEDLLPWFPLLDVLLLLYYLKLIPHTFFRRSDKWN